MGLLGSGGGRGWGRRNEICGESCVRLGRGVVNVSGDTPYRHCRSFNRNQMCDMDLKHCLCARHTKLLS